MAKKPETAQKRERHMSNQATISTPLYLRIKNHILARISSGEWPPGTRIGSESEFASLFAASRMTVNRALRELTDEGRVLRRQGRGTFVAPAKAQSALLEINSIAEEIRTRGGRYSCTVHLLTEEKASPALAAIMGLKAYAPIFHSIIIHRDADIPLQLADRFVNPAIAPDYLRQDFTRITPNEYLLRVAPISTVEHLVEALIPEAWIRDLLEINEAEPCLALHRTTWVEEVVATRSRFYSPGSRYSLGGRFSPSGGGTIRVF
jgi:GntR family histidine utilization transcriptional repressor